MRAFLFCVFASACMAWAQWNYTTDSLALQIVLDSSGCKCAVASDFYATRFYPAIVESVSVVRDGRIRSLWLSQGVSSCTTSRLRPEIANITELETLDISYNHLTELPRELFSLRKLTFLDLSGNAFPQLPNDVGNLRSLRFLRVWAGELTSLPDSIGRLDSLTSLNLRLNKISSLPSSISGLQSLRFLLLSQNRIDTLSRAICALKNLVELELWRNSIAYVPPEIGNLTQLMLLDLSSNRICALPNEIGRVQNPNLWRIFLSGNNLRDLPDSITNIERLVMLDSNNLCSLECRVQQWADTTCGTRWRNTQRCAVLPVPPCSTPSIVPRLAIAPPKTDEPVLLFDLRGRFITSSANFPKSQDIHLLSGVYVALPKRQGLAAKKPVKIVVEQ